MPASASAAQSRLETRPQAAWGALVTPEVLAVGSDKRLNVLLSTIRPTDRSQPARDVVAASPGWPARTLRQASTGRAAGAIRRPGSGQPGTATGPVGTGPPSRAVQPPGRDPATQGRQATRRTRWPGAVCEVSTRQEIRLVHSARWR